MTTVADFIKDTLCLLQVNSVSQPVKAADMSTGIRFLNRLCTRLEANGVTMGWSPVANPTDTLPLPPEAELGVMYVLAMMLAPQWGVTPLPLVAVGAETFLADLRRDVAVATPLRPILGAPCPDRGSMRTLNGSSWYLW